MLRALCAIVTATVLFAAPASALEPDECELPSKVEISACMSALYKQADAELNAVYKRAMASIDEADYMDAEERDKWKTSLRDAQRAWLTFKEYDCGELIYFEWWGGTGAGTASLECQIDATRLRTSNLKSRY
jgi:uncharacterized protein YecT (DUF1311 family)